jgi:hypothetical protein
LAWFPQTAVLYTSASTKTGEVKMLLNNVDVLLKLLMLKHCSAGRGRRDCKMMIF